MKLKEIALQKLPGLQFRSMNIASFSEGMNIIFGPNGSGKTSLCHAVRQLLWPENLSPWSSITVHSEWICQGETFTVALDDGYYAVSHGGKKFVDSLPDAYLMPCFSITIDELFDSKDDVLAQKIAQAMAGGYNIAAAQKRLTSGAIGAKSAIAEWKSAAEAWERDQRDQQLLQHECAELPLLTKEIQDAEAANKRVALLDQILAAKGCKNKCVELADVLKTFPFQLQKAQVEAGDWDLHVYLTKKKQEIKSEINLLSEQKKILQQALEDFKPIDLPHGELDRQLDRIGRMQQLQSAKENLLSTCSKLENTMQAHYRLLGIKCEADLAKLDANHLDSLEERWLELDQRDLKISSLKEHILHCNCNSTVPAEKLSQASQLLAELSASQPISMVTVLLALCVTLSCSVAFFLPLEGWWRFYALLPASAFVLLAILDSSKRQRRLKEDYNKLQLPPMPIENAPSLPQQLQHTVAAWGQAQHIETLLQRKKELERSLAVEKLLREELWLALCQQAALAGVAALPQSRYRFADNIKRLYTDWINLQTERIALAGAAEKLTLEWQQWHNFAALFNMRADSTANVYDLAKIHARIKEKLNACDNVKQIDNAQIEKERHLALVTDDIHSLLQRSGCQTNPYELKAIVAQLTSYRELQIQQRHQEQLLQQFKESLGEANSARIEETNDNLHSERDLYLAQAKTLQALSERKGRLQSKIETCEKGTRGQQLAEGHAQKFTAVKAAARDFAKKELLDMLIADTQKTFQRECQPRLLQQAASWFARFTKHAFSLSVPVTESGEIIFEVIENRTRERKTLAQLSRGTRMQLLLAVRLAFALDAETDLLKVPIILDEILATSDPQRFESILDVIAELVARGSQVFYLTSQPQEIARWQALCPDAKLIDLAQLQGEQAFEQAPWQAFIPVATFKPPLGPDAESYAIELKLPALRLDQPLAMAPVHYLVDSSAELYKLLQAGVDSYGTLSQVDPKMLSQSFNSFEAIAHRCRLLEQFFALSTQGRGKHLTRSCLVEGGVSKAFIDRIWPLAQGLNRDAKALITTFESKKDERTKRFGVEALQQLVCYLTDSGYLDPRPILTANEIRQACLPVTQTEEDRLFIEKLLTHTSQETSQRQ